MQHPCIDTHQHLWDLKKFNVPWLDGLDAINRSFMTSDYMEATANSNVTKAVYMEVDVAADQKLKEAEHIIGLCQDDAAPTVAAVIAGNPSAPDFADFCARFRGSPYIKGIRQVFFFGDAPPPPFWWTFIPGKGREGQRKRRSANRQRQLQAEKPTAVSCRTRHIPCLKLLLATNM